MRERWFKILKGPRDLSKVLRVDGYQLVVSAKRSFCEPQKNFNITHNCHVVNILAGVRCKIITYTSH